VTWLIPNGGSPDMGGGSADGRVLWLSGRYNSEVYAIDSTDGHLLARIKVGKGPHRLCVWPQPGRYSLRHTGIIRCTKSSLDVARDDAERSRRVTSRKSQVASRFDL